MGTAAAAATGPPPAERVGRFAWERALDDADLPVRTVLVALALATFASADGTHAFPGEKKLAKRSHLPPSTVREHLKRLRETGWARRVSRGSTGSTRDEADEYHLCVPLAVPAAAAVELVEVLEVLEDPPAAARSRSSSTSTTAGTSSTTAGSPAVVAATTAGSPAVVPDDHRWLAGRPPLASEQTTAGQPAPTNHYQAITKGGAAELVDVDTAAAAAAAVPAPPRGAAPRCPRHSDTTPGAWVPEPCRDCAELGRAHRAFLSDAVRAHLRIRRACADCDDQGWLLDTPLDVARRCRHPNVPADAWGDPPAAAAPPSSPGGRHRRRPPASPPPAVPAPRAATLEDLARVAV